jgi:uncharacterized protein
MKISLERFSGYTIHAYEPGAVSVRGPSAGTADHPEGDPEVTVYRHSIIVTPGEVLADWAPRSLDELQAAHMAQLARFGAQVVLLGSGDALRFPSVETLRPLVEAGVGYEIMDTGAACRTYNILAAEGRLVVAGLIIG